jgi:hypothetical protein
MSIVEVNVAGLHFTRTLPDLRRVLRIHPLGKRSRQSEIRQGQAA